MEHENKLRAEFNSKVWDKNQNPDSIYDWFISLLRQDREELKQAILNALWTHEEGEDLGYCDTGSDMEMVCRSECVEMAAKRINSLLQSKHESKP